MHGTGKEGHTRPGGVLLIRQALAGGLGVPSMKTADGLLEIKASFTFTCILRV